MAASLFDVLPDKFFNLLAGKNKAVYAKVLDLIYEQSILNRFGIPQAHLRDYIEELLEAGVEGGGIPVFMEEADEDGIEPSRVYTSGESPEEVHRGQANAVLRRLEKLGWIQSEVRDGYETFIILPDYTNRLLGLFKEIREAKPVEYQRYAYITYQILTGNEVRMRPAFVVREAYDYTCQLEKELLILFQNMKQRTEELADKSSISEVLDHHFNVYQDEIAEKSYHRLKTSDHVSRYRFQILQRVKRWLIDDDLMQETIKDGLANNYYDSAEESQQQMWKMLQGIEEIYESLDDIFNEIDIRHNRYLRSSYDRARYMSQSSSGDDQRLIDMLTQISVIYAEEFVEEVEVPPLVHLNELQFLYEKSFLTPRNRRPVHRPNIHHVIDVPIEWKEEKINHYKARLKRQITPEKVEKFVNEKLGDRERMEMREFIPETLDQYLMVGYVFLYGADSESAYRIERKEEREIVQIGEYRFSNHVISRGGESD